MMNLQMQLATLRQAWFWKRVCVYILYYTVVCYGFKALNARHVIAPLTSRWVFQLISAFSVIAFSIWIGRSPLQRTDPDQPLRNQ